MRVLVSGAGIAGPCLAYWLRRYGFEPTIVERAPRLRTGGYVIDFWGAGFDVADRMGIVPDLLERGYHVKELRQVDRRGRRISGFPVRVFDAIEGGRLTTIARSDLAACVHDALGGGVETIFDDAIAAMEESAGSVRVRFERSAPRAFDLVVGADGLHSRVRELAFGPSHRFEHYLGLKVAAFSVRGYRPRDELAYVVHTELGRQIGRFAMRDDETIFLFAFEAADPAIPTELAEQRALLRATFADHGWEAREILAALDGVETLYIDRVSQIRMPRWTKGRIALVGDAACCISPLGGQGSALAMVGAYVLAGELAEARGDYSAAFARYWERLGSRIESKQKAAVRLAPFFAPKSKVKMFLRNQVMKLMSVPFVAKLAVGRELADRIELPAYASARPGLSDRQEPESRPSPASRSTSL